MQNLKKQLEIFAKENIQDFHALLLAPCNKCAKYSYRCTVAFKNKVYLSFPISTFEDFLSKATDYDLL